MQIYCLIHILLCFFFSTRCSDAITKNDFVDDFVFGAGSSAYQWEGAVNEDGRKPSIWDSFAHSHIKGNGDTTCDGYHKYKEDVQLMVETGLDAFRLSISWSRLIPNGRGPINPKGVLFYKNLINQLTSHGIQPHVTLHHFDLPQALEDEYGGWLDRRIIQDFTAYAEICFREFGDSVKFWTTLNEANVFAIGGYVDGNTPPGHCSPNTGFVNCSTGNSSTEPYIAMHHMLLAHASVARLYKQSYKDIQGGFVGISLFVFSFIPYTGSKDDSMATQRAKAFYLGWILDPITFGDYPAEMKRRVGSRLPIFTDEESELVKGSSDFIGVVHYSTVYVKNQRHNQPSFYTDMGIKIMFIGNASLFEFGVHPWGMEKVLEYIKHTYSNPPIYILENGQTTKHGPSLIDTARVTYIDSYIAVVCSTPLGMVPMYEGTWCGHSWTCTSYCLDTSTLLDCTMLISVIPIVRDHRNYPLIGTLLFSKATRAFLVPKASRSCSCSCRAASLHQLLLPSNVVAVIS